MFDYSKIVIELIFIRDQLHVQAPHQNAKGVHICLLRVGLVVEDLGRGVHGRADGVRVTPRGFVGDHSACPKVGDLDTLWRVHVERHNKQVVRLQVAVEHVVVVKERHPLCAVERNREFQLVRETLRLEHFAERAERRKLHHDAVVLVVRDRPIERHDVRRAQPLEKPDFLCDFLRRLGRDRGAEILDRDLCPAPQAAVHGAKCALADELFHLQLVVVELRGERAFDADAYLRVGLCGFDNDGESGLDLRRAEEREVDRYRVLRPRLDDQGGLGRLKLHTLVVARQIKVDLDLLAARVLHDDGLVYLLVDVDRCVACAEIQNLWRNLESELWGVDANLCHPLW